MTDPLDDRSPWPLPVGNITFGPNPATADLLASKPAGPEHLLQDQSRALTDALASKPDAMRLAREAAAEIRARAGHPTLAECEAVGRGPDNYPGKPYDSGGLPDTPDERARFEAYMRGHCWEAGPYDEAVRSYSFTMTRCLYGVWRDRGWLAMQQPDPATPRITIHPITEPQRPGPDATVIVWHRAGWSRGFYAAQGGEWFDEEHNLLAGVTFWGEVA